MGESQARYHAGLRVVGDDHASQMATSISSNSQQGFIARAEICGSQ